MTAPSMAHRLTAEFFGTFWLVFGGCGAAVFAVNPAGDYSVGIGYLGMALAFGLTMLTGVYVLGPISGGHFNPGLTLGAAIAKRIEWRALPSYWAAQVIGALLAGLAVLIVAKGRPKFNANSHLAANGYGVNSPHGYSLTAVLVTEVLLTGVLVLVFLSATDDRAPKGFAGLTIGLTLTAIHLISIPISNTSVNPARSTGVAFFNAAGAPGQLWLFWTAPLIGAALAAALYPALLGRTTEDIPTDR